MSKTQEEQKIFEFNAIQLVEKSNNRFNCGVTFHIGSLTQIMHNI